MCLISRYDVDTLWLNIISGHKNTCVNLVKIFHDKTAI